MTLTHLCAALLLAGCAVDQTQRPDMSLPEPSRSIAFSVERKNGPDAERRCTDAYQRETRWEFYADDRDDCPGLSPPPDPEERSR